jgi:hypothetical protein
LEVDSDFNKNGNGAAPARVPADHVPMPGGNAVTSSNPGFSGFSGITNLDQASAGTGAYAGTQFDLEPPDQALAVGNGEVVEAVNNAIAVYDPSGNLLSGPTPMNQFFGLAPEASTATPPVFGPFLSDPKAYFDTDTQRWFVTELILDVAPSTGNLTGTSGVIIAVSTSPDATGTYNVFRLDTTDVTGTTPDRRRRQWLLHHHQRIPGVSSGIQWVTSVCDVENRAGGGHDAHGGPLQRAEFSAGLGFFLGAAGNCATGRHAGKRPGWH